MVDGFVGYHYQLRLILIGDSTVGKTSLINELQVKETGNLDYSTTLGVDYYSKIYHKEDNIIKIQVWDTAGQDRYRSIVRTYYRNAIGGLLVFDITNRTTFDNIDIWLQEAREAQGDGRQVYILVGNKSDLANRREVSADTAHQYAQRNNMIYIETSAATGDNVEQAFEMLVECVMNLISQGGVAMNHESWDGVRQGQVLTHSMLTSTNTAVSREELGESVVLSNNDPIHNRKKCACVKK